MSSSSNIKTIVSLKYVLFGLVNVHIFIVNYMCRQAARLLFIWTRW